METDVISPAYLTVRRLNTEDVYARIHEISLQMQMSCNRSQEFGENPGDSG